MKGQVEELSSFGDVEGAGGNTVEFVLILFGAISQISQKFCIFHQASL